MSEPISGYRTLSAGEIEAINAIKNIANEIGKAITDISRDDEIAADPRWLAIARTDLQTGFMTLVRSIAKPQGF